MRLIGLTGGIATGKSTVARLLAARGAVVIDADQLAREVVEPGQPALADIVDSFGPEVLAADGTLDRARLGALVFGDADRLRRLNDLTHPRILALMQERLAEALGGDAPLVVLDIPLLFENRRATLVEAVLLVYADPATQLRRLVERDGFGETEARRRIASQMPIDEKRALATWVVDNSGTPEETRRQVDRWWEENVDGARPGA